MNSKVPTCPRDVFELLAEFDEAKGPGELLDRFDWTGVTPHQIYAIFLARLPESAQVAKMGANYSASTHAQRMLHSDEFQREATRLILQAFPEKKRLLSVHIPKTAGIDLNELFYKRYPSLDDHVGRKEWTSKAQLFCKLRNFVRRMHDTDSIFVTRHSPLSWFVERSLNRFGDRLFAVVRHPFEIPLSYTNYILKRFYENPACSDPDTCEWAGLAGLESFDAAISTSELRRLGGRILTNTVLVPGNLLTTYLGNRTCESSLELMARSNIELTDIARYNQWLREYWGIDSKTRANRSPAIVTLDSLDNAERTYLSNTYQEDMKLYPIILAALERHRSCRVFGSEVA